MDLTSVAAQVWEMEAWIFSAALLLGLLRSSRAQNHVYELLMSFFTPRQINGQTDLWLRNAKLTMPLRAGQIDHSAVSAYSAFGPQNKGANSAFCRAEKKSYKSSNL
ncbi:NERD domain-containing protein [Pseudomonas koreensis]|uniref:NERD domain-containing protein n=1 Tax=Pseudomonas koreensis TaxID=198620 RepID=UPI0014737754|nr:NERD domain-containing protein [Pseudomonas koreensis]NNA58262.1 NERD domain-containing protein [Pseudomonas koreensis]